MKNKISKLSKIIMALLMTFTYVAPVTQVVADAIEQTYELELALDTGYNLNIKNVGTKEFEATTNYLVEVIPTFTYNDNTTKNGITTYQNIIGSGLTSGTNVTVDSVETAYNGTYSIITNIYPANTDITVADADYVKTATKLVTASYTNDITDKDSGIVIKNNDIILGNDEVIELKKDSSTKIINLNVAVNKGNTNPINDYSLNETINNTYTETNISEGNITLDFTNVLYGTYVYEYNLIKTNGDVIETNKITINYGEKAENGDITTYFADPLKDDLSKIISYTSLTDEEKELVGDDYNLLPYTRYDLSLDNLLNLNNKDLVFNYYTGKSGSVESVPFVGSNSEKGRLTETDEISKVSDLLSVITGLNDKFVSGMVYDKNGTPIVVDTNNDPYLETGMFLKINYYGVEKNYPVYISQDYNGGLVDETDVKALIDAALVASDVNTIDRNLGDFNDDGKLNIQDATAVVNAINIKNWTPDESSYNDNLKADLTKDDSLIRVGDELTIIYKVSDIIKANGISGTISYDKNLLELESAIVSDGWYGNVNTDNGNFMYVTSSSSEEATVVFTFKTLAEVKTTSVNIINSSAAANGKNVAIGETTELEFAIDRALHTNNYLANLVPSVGILNFGKTVNDYTIYVGSYVDSISFSGGAEDAYATVTGLSSYNLNYGINDIKIAVTAEDGKINTYNIQVIKEYPKSSNTTLTNIAVGGHELKFDPEVLEYDLTVNSDVTSLDLIITPEDANSVVSVKGNENFKEGKNKVEITVTAEDGSEKTYTINVTKKASKATLDTKKDSSSTGEKIIVIILIILVILGLLYLIFKKEGEPLFPKKNKSIAKKVTPIKKEQPLARKVEPKVKNNNTKK